MDTNPVNSTDDFDPDGVGQPNGNIFCLPHSAAEAAVVILPVPWDVTTSYRPGTANGPEAILNASDQLDLSDNIYGAEIWKYGVRMLDIESKWKDLNDALRPVSESCIEWAENGEPIIGSEEVRIKLETINRACETLRDWISVSTEELLDQGKLVGILGGEHSVPLGFIQVLSKRYDEIGILHIDAHADLRETYENFTSSHASIFFNSLSIKSLKSLVQVGLRDTSPGETKLINSDDRIHAFPEWHLRQALNDGMNWKELCDQIIDRLPQHVYVSFDIDGLDPSHYRPSFRV